MPKCEHDLAEMETECADGVCPICLRVQVSRLKATVVSLLAEFVPIEGHGTGAHDDDCTVCGTIKAANTLLDTYGR